MRRQEETHTFAPSSFSMYLPNGTANRAKPSPETKPLSHIEGYDVLGKFIAVGQTDPDAIAEFDDGMQTIRLDKMDMSQEDYLVLRNYGSVEIQPHIRNSVNEAIIANKASLSGKDFGPPPVVGGVVVRPRRTASEKDIQNNLIINKAFMDWVTAVDQKKVGPEDVRKMNDEIKRSVLGGQSLVFDDWREIMDNGGIKHTPPVAVQPDYKPAPTMDGETREFVPLGKGENDGETREFVQFKRKSPSRGDFGLPDVVFGTIDGQRVKIPKEKEAEAVKNYGFIKE